jgi:hypothetical protein
MTQQLQLNFRPKKIQKGEYPEGLTLEERFEKFHEGNPHVASMLTQMALQLKDKGRRHFGMKALFETLRFWTALETTG